MKIIASCWLYLVVIADASGLPAAVVAARIALIQLIAELFVPAHVENRHAKGTFATELRVGLFDVAQVGH